MNTARNYFVTGTDTEVGKTLVAGALIVKLRDAGLNAVGFKPVVAGTYMGASGYALNEDLETLRIASNLTPNKFSLCPYVLDEPAAPHLVAKNEGLHLDCATILKAQAELQSEFHSMVVEGAGGFLVPLNETEDLGDLAQALDFPVIVTVGMRLGCLNHALLTCEAIQSRQLAIAGWVANTCSERMPLFEENLQTLKERIFAPCLGVIPSLPQEFAKSPNAPYSIEALRFAAEHINLPE